ncbi:hypothetical protein LINGRAHAP2_LOCUS16999 [Linum grandiflorum]
MVEKFDHRKMRGGRIPLDSEVGPRFGRLLDLEMGGQIQFCILGLRLYRSWGWDVFFLV